MHEIDLLGSAPMRPSDERLKLIRQAGRATPSADFEDYGYDYFDNTEYGVGYGGYVYDGRYRSAVERLVKHFGLRPGASVLEVGCAKGFILYEFHALGFHVTGVDASAYAIAHAKEEVRHRLILGTGSRLPFADGSFDLVLAKEVIPHLEEEEALNLIAECMRVSNGRGAFLEIQCAEGEQSAELMKAWDVTHKTIKPKAWWAQQLARLGYSGAFHCKVLF